MAHRVRFCAAAALTVLAGCSSDAPPAARTAVVHGSAGVAVVQNPSGAVPACLLSDGPVLSIGEADGGEAYQLYRLFGATRLSDGRIALVNQGSQELRYYDGDGRHLLSSGGPGDGPGEFRDAFYLWQLPGDTIWVGDYGPFQFLVFSPAGEWVGTVRPTPEYANSPGVMAVLDDGRSVLGAREVTSPGAQAYDLRYQPVLIHARDGAFIDSIGVYPNGRWGNVAEEGRPGLFIYPLFESFAEIDAAGSTMVIGHGSEASLSVYDLTDTPELTRVIEWDPGDRVVSAADVRAAYDEYRARYAGLDPAMVAQLVEPMVSDRRPVADVFPAFSEVEIGRDGTIWIREYPRPGSSSRQTWTAFGVDGQRQCTVSLEASEIYEFGSDYMLVEDVDELGVERVLMYALEKSGAP